MLRVLLTFAFEYTLHLIWFLLSGLKQWKLLDPINCFASLFAVPPIPSQGPLPCEVA